MSYKNIRNSYGRRDFLTESVAALVGAGLLGEALASKALAAPHQHSGDIATHNMLVVGEKSVFLSHLPMFKDQDNAGNLVTTPHRFQAILEATLTRGNSMQPQSVYTADRRRHQTAKIYMLNPTQTFMLSSLVSNPPRRSFKGRIFRGHFERDGRVAILNDIDVTVKTVVHFHEFDPQAARPDKLEYLFFGKGDELFMAHLITSPPDFDQIFSVQIPDHQFTDAQLGKGVRVVFSERANSVPSRIKEGEQAAGEISVGDAPQKIQVKALREFYFEEGELQAPSVFETTSEERSAGFP
jgi:hypothetical protein